MKLFLVVLLAAVCSAHYAPLYRVKDVIPGQYIIQFNDGVHASDGADKVRSLPFFSLFGGEVRKVYNMLGGISASLSPRALDLIRKLDIVKYVEENQIVRPLALASWGIDRVDQRTTSLDSTFNPAGDGSNVDIYIIDTGLRVTHSEFGSRATTGPEMDFCSTNKGGIDEHGHGTHCAGTAAGTTYGVAKNANIFGVKVLCGRLGFGSTEGVNQGIDYVAAQTPKVAAVASMSLGGGFSQAQNDAVQRLYESGKPVAVAAGNDDQDASGYSPASAPNAITVGASDNADCKASFSNYGDLIDIWAPGVGITSSTNTDDNSSETWNGTSMACPHVAGALAIFLSKDPSMNPAAVFNHLVEQSTKSVMDIPVLRATPCKDVLYCGN